MSSQPSSPGWPHSVLVFRGLGASSISFVLRAFTQLYAQVLLWAMFREPHAVLVIEMCKVST